MEVVVRCTWSGPHVGGMKRVSDRGFTENELHQSKLYTQLPSALFTLTFIEALIARRARARGAMGRSYCSCWLHWRVEGLEGGGLPAVGCGACWPGRCDLVGHGCRWSEGQAVGGVGGIVAAAAERRLRLL